MNSQTSRNGRIENVTERRVSRRYTMSLPITIRANACGSAPERSGKTRDVSSRALYFVTDADCDPSAEIQFVLTLPKWITLATDVKIHCFGRVVRVEHQDARRGVVARIERYEFLRASD